MNVPSVLGFLRTEVHKESTIQQETCAIRGEAGGGGKIKETWALLLRNSHPGGDLISKVGQSDRLPKDKDANKEEKGKVLSYPNLFPSDLGHQAMAFYLLSG